MLKFDNNPKVKQIALQILTLSLVDQKLLNYSPSQVAASSIIVAINIYMVQNELKEGKSDQDPSSFFYIKKNERHFMQKASEKRLLNTDVWNNFMVSSQTGFSIEMLKPCLFELSRFIEEYLEPNKLKYFDIEAIK